MASLIQVCVFLTILGAWFGGLWWVYNRKKCEKEEVLKSDSDEEGVEANDSQEEEDGPQRR